MFAIIGAAGTVGYSTSWALRQKGLPVRAILRTAVQADRLRSIGCDIALADLQNPESLVAALKGAEKIQIILPPSIRADDPAMDLRRSIDSLVAVLDQVRPQRVLAISDYGAHVDDDIGMPSVFRSFEARLGQLGGEKLVLRSAEHMENWMRSYPAAVVSGILASFQDPVDKMQPTISAGDLGMISAALLQQSLSKSDLRVIHAEGPRRYSAQDVAAAFANLSGKPVRAEAIARSQWKEMMERVIPETLAELLIKANDAKNRGGLVDIEPGAEDVRRGTTELMGALRQRVP